MACYARDLLATASAEIGYHEKATNANLESKTANSGSNNWNRYANFIDTNYPNFYNFKKNGYEWCDIFVDYCFIKTFGYNNALRLLCQPEKSAGAGCIYSYGYYKAKGQVGSIPRVGAQIFFGKTENGLYHTGLVERFDDTYVYTIEGNCNNMVARRSYKRVGSTVFGYGYPAFDTLPAGQSSKPVEESANQTPNGDTVASNPSTPEANANNVSSIKSIKWYGKVTASTLNFRTYAGTNYPTLKSMPTLKKGTKVGVCASVKAADGGTWYYIVVNGIYGFVSSSYITRA